MVKFDALSRRTFLAGTASAVGMLLTGSALVRPRRARAQKLKVVEGVTLSPPSNSSFLEAIIKGKKFDQKHGIDLKITRYRTLATMYADFAKRKTPVALSPAFYNAAKFYSKGIPIQYTFTYSTANQAIMTKNPKIRNIEDLRGKRMAATTGSGFYGMTELALRRHGLNSRKDLELITAAPPAVRTQLEVGKIDAGVVWAETVPELLLKGFHIVGDITADIRAHLKMGADEPVWYLGDYAFKDWLEEDPERIRSLYLAYRDAARFWLEQQNEAVSLVAELTKLPEKVLHYTIAKKLVEFRIEPAIQQKENIKKSLQAFIDVGFLDEMPNDGIFYPWPQLKG
ncbi:MAG: ABC transporter substrate-binding protein [Candidatus Tectomicrobia bacterium]|nr:ABC transporter substrate-binding protein [Candidatus Tectomicrobia bacterium]